MGVGLMGLCLNCRSLAEVTYYSIKERDKDKVHIIDDQINKGEKCDRCGWKWDK